MGGYGPIEMPLQHRGSLHHTKRRADLRKGWWRACRIWGGGWGAITCTDPYGTRRFEIVAEGRPATIESCARLLEASCELAHCVLEVGRVRLRWEVIFGFEMDREAQSKGMIGVDLWSLMIWSLLCGRYYVVAHMIFNVYVVWRRVWRSVCQSMSAMTNRAVDRILHLTNHLATPRAFISLMPKMAILFFERSSRGFSLSQPTIKYMNTSQSEAERRESL